MKTTDKCRMIEIMVTTMIGFVTEDWSGARETAVQYAAYMFAAAGYYWHARGGKGDFLVVPADFAIFCEKNSSAIRRYRKDNAQAFRELGEQFVADLIPAEAMQTGSA